MIHATNIIKDFGKLRVLNQVNLTCNKGECFALIGPNGCGKTTLIKSILGMVIPTSGEIAFDGKQIKNDFSYRKHIGYMPQIGRYPDNMKVGQIIDMIKNIRHHEESFDEDLVTQFRLKDIYNKRMRTLSGGTTQKVSATLAFLFNPSVLILDEPTAGLDPLAAEILKEKIISERKKGKLVLITSHLLSELDELISEIVFMQDGRIKFHKSIEDLRANTHEQKISKAIANILKNQNNE
jgi:Cu-processing system ATP-binding protein